MITPFRLPLHRHLRSLSACPGSKPSSYGRVPVTGAKSSEAWYEMRQCSCNASKSSIMLVLVASSCRINLHLWKKMAMFFFVGISAFCPIDRHFLHPNGWQQISKESRICSRLVDLEVNWDNAVVNKASTNTNRTVACETFLQSKMVHD